MKRTLSLILVFLFLYPNCKAIQNFKVEISNRNPGAIPSYTFRFTLQKTLKVHEYVKFVFPKGTTFRDLTKEELTNPGFIPGFSGLAIIDHSENSLKMNTNIEFASNYEMVVTIPFDSSLEITNPKEPGTYVYKISTQAEPTAIVSEPVEIFSSAITTPVLDIEAPLANDVAGYSLDFVTSPFGKLVADKNDTLSSIHNVPGNINESTDLIIVRFPNEFVFTKNAEILKSNWIMVNDAFLRTPPTIEGNDLIIKVPRNINNHEEVSIKIDCRVGIKTHKRKGNVMLSVFTSSDIIPVWTTSIPLR